MYKKLIYKYLTETLYPLIIPSHIPLTPRPHSSSDPNERQYKKMKLKKNINI